MMSSQKPLRFLEFRTCPSVCRSVVALDSRHASLKISMYHFRNWRLGNQKRKQIFCFHWLCWEQLCHTQSHQQSATGSFPNGLWVDDPKILLKKCHCIHLPVGRQMQSIFSFFQQSEKINSNGKRGYSFGGPPRALSSAGFWCWMYLKPLSPAHPAGRGNLITEMKSYSSWVI